MAADNNKFVLIPVLNASGAISEIKLIMNGGKPDVFVPVKPPFDSMQQLSEYAGTYYSDELNVDHKLTLQGNNLVLQIGENFENRLNAAYADYFTIQGGVINLTFNRDDKGKITGFVFNAGADGRDVKGITFKRK
jgi:hypothetical protein